MTTIYDQAKARLDETKLSISARRERLARHVSRRAEPLPQDFAEQAVELENDETMVALEEELQELLLDVDGALARLEAGDYGACTICGDAVEPGRLDALPATPYCIKCAQAQEN